MIKLNPENQLGNLIENQFGEHYLFSVNRRSFEQLDYSTQFNKEFGQTFKQKDTLYIIAGTDSGLMIKELLKSPPDKGSTFLFIEFPEIIDLIHTQYDLSKQKRIIVTTEDKWQDEAMKVGMDIYFMINRFKRIKSFGAQYYFLEEYLYLWQVIEATTNHLIWQYQSQLGSKTFVQRQLENLTENHSPAIVLKDYFKGKSALILAGGPSLDHYIDWIEENQKNFIVIAVTRIARRLLQTKIKPDIFVSVDPHIYNFNVSKEVLNYEKSSLLVNQFHITPALLGNWFGVNLYLGDLFPWQTPLNKQNITGIGPTVTNTAILLAINMGIKTQILFGVDLCYSIEGFTHAKGSHEHENGPKINEIGQTVTTNKGETAETNSAYFDAITTIEQLAELATKSGSTLINPSPDSARMNNVEHVNIDEIPIANEKVSIQKLLHEQIELKENKNYLIKHYQNVLKELRSAQFKMNKIIELATRGIDYNEKFFKGNDPEKNFKFKIKMDKVEKELNNKNLTLFTELSKKFGANEFLYFLKPDEGMDWTNDEIKLSAMTYYKALETGAKKLSKCIFTAINRTETRLIENNRLNADIEMLKRHFCSLDKTTLLNKAEPDLKKKIKQNVKNFSNEYLEKFSATKELTDEFIRSIGFSLVIFQNGMNHQHRRIQLLEKNNPELYNISDTIMILGKSVDEIKKSHQQASESFLFSKKSDKQDYDLDGLEIKLYNLFIQEESKAIKRVIDSLELLKENTPEKDSFIHLAKGYYEELCGNTDLAINEYGLSNHETTTESALKRLAYITLNTGEIEYAHNILQVLCDISPSYLTQLAGLYTITKNYKDALESYTQYLDYNPQDISILIKVAQLYESQDVLDGAEFIYNKILEIDPDNLNIKKQLDTIRQQH